MKKKKKLVRRGDRAGSRLGLQEITRTSKQNETKPNHEELFKEIK